MQLEDIMKKGRLLAVACLAGLWFAGEAAAGAVQPVTDAAASLWIDYLIPRPKEIHIERKLTIPASAVSVRADPDAGVAARQAASELRDLFGPATTNLPATAPGGFTIVLGRVAADKRVEGLDTADLERLRMLPNSRQAYLIRPAGNRRLVIAALDERGLYYGVQTLKQLATPFLKDGQVILPLAVITDWPDLEERGLWNSPRQTPGFMQWMAGLKLNFEHFGHPVNLNPDEERCPPLPMEQIQQARAYALHLMPHCQHYDFWVADARNKPYYPADLIGRGATARNPASVASPDYNQDLRAPCASNPRLRNYLTEWLLSAGGQGVRETCLWMTEYQPSYCSCEKCLPEGSERRQLQLETIASVAAIAAARKTYPDLVTRIFITTKNEQESAECLALLPRDDSSIRADVYSRTAAVDAHAAAGNWVASYGGAGGGAVYLDHLSRGAYQFRLFPAPAAVRESLQAHCAIGYDGVYTLSYGVPGLDWREKGYVDRQYGDYLIPMLAEWSWNVSGRTVREFNRAWATRRGYNDIDKALAWLELMAPLEEFAYCALRDIRQHAEIIRRREPIRFTHGPAAEAIMPENAERQFAELIAAAGRAAQLAAELQAPDMLAESGHVRAALDLLRGLCRLSLAVAPAGSQTAVAPAPALDAIREAARQMTAHTAAVIQAWPDVPATAKKQFTEHANAYIAQQVQTIESAVGTGRVK